MFYGSLDTDKNLRPNRKHYSADGSMEIKENILTGEIEFVTYLGGDGYSAPVVYKKNYDAAGVTQDQMLYLHRDYQGSILAITNQVGVVLEKRQFDAWGAIIQVQDGAGNVLNGLILLDRGYTGHEHLQSVGLINMNGRLYDPKLHRFLQPDNYVQDVSDTQNYNRYGYVLNNPLKYTDPSGELSFKSIGGWFAKNANDILAAAAIIGGTAILIFGGPAFAYLGYSLIGSGIAHFGAAYSEYTKTGDWAKASNNAGFSFSYSQSVDWFDGSSKTDTNGVSQSAPTVPPKSDTDTDGGNNSIQPDGGDRSHICTSGVLYPKPPIFRLPDYVNVNASVSLPVGGGLIGWNGSLSLSRYGNVYFSPLGFSVGKSLFEGGSLSITANWLNQSAVPSAYQMNNFLSGNGFNAGGGYWIGGGETWSPGNGTATGAGFYTPQIGGSYNYTPNTLIFGSNFKW